MPRTFEFKDLGRVELVQQLKVAAKKQQSGLWAAVARKLGKSRRSRSEVNLHKINKHTAKGDIIVVPGKVLGDGSLEHQVDIAAYRFTEGAVKKISEAGGRALKIIELVKSNPKGSKIKIIG
ncbi:MAG: 50S ribosomal protein L18e [Candidatus Altiarchaeales archaeon]|nr:50S ribosomal protein L18e [Candidatus Altiarchaeales archaeon]